MIGGAQGSCISQQCLQVVLIQPGLQPVFCNHCKHLLDLQPCEHNPHFSLLQMRTSLPSQLIFNGIVINMLRKDLVTQYFAACKYNLGSSVARLLGVNSETFHFISNELCSQKQSTFCLCRNACIRRQVMSEIQCAGKWIRYRPNCPQFIFCGYNLICSPRILIKS